MVTEGTRGLGFYLATIDSEVSENQLKEIATNKIYLVVPEEVKEKIEHYRVATNVITFETFFENFLDPKITYWKKSKII